MRRLFTACSAAVLALAALTGLAPSAGAATDIEAALRGIPGLTIVKEDPAPAGFRFFELTFTRHGRSRRTGRNS